jgi:RHS repeat-associated protein
MTHTITLTPTISPTPDGQPPLAEFSAPGEWAEIDGPALITGTVKGSPLREYWLDFQAPGDPGWTRAFSGSQSVLDGPLGVLDPTLSLNGQVVLRLTACDIYGYCSQVQRQVVFVGQRKLGALTLAFTDLQLSAGSGPAINVTRSYDSRDRSQGDFGPGWRLDLGRFLVQESGILGDGWVNSRDTCSFLQVPNYCTVEAWPHRVVVTLPDGRAERFKVSLTRACRPGAPEIEPLVGFEALPGTLGKLEVFGTSPYAYNASAFPCGSNDAQLLDSSGEFYDPQAYRYIAPDGTAYTLDQAQGLQAITDVNGNVLNVSSAGVVSSRGTATAFQRDGQGRITRITDPAGASLTYEYNAQGRLSRMTDRAGTVTRFTYDPAGRLASILDSGGVSVLRGEYDAQGRLLRSFDADGASARMDHDVAGRTATVTDRLGNATVLLYDTRGNVLSSTNALGQVSSYTYDTFDNKLSETDPAGNVTQYTYDARGNLLTQTDPRGQVSRYTYDARGRVLSVTDPLGRVTRNSYDAKGNLLSSTDAVGGVSSYAYSSQGDLLRQTDALGQSSFFTYDNQGRALTQTDPLGRTTTWQYDANGNRVLEMRPGPTGTVQSSFSYDANGRLITATQPNGAVSRSDYDAQGRLALSRNALNRDTTYSYDAQGRQLRTSFPDGTYEENGYDAEGRRTSHRRRDGTVMAYEYDVLGRLTRSTHPDGAFTHTVYNAAGRVVEEFDEMGRRTAFAYDAAGRRTSVTDPVGRTTTYSYDNAGNLTSMTDARGKTTQHAYDALNRRTRTTFHDGSYIETGYDALGRRVSERDQAGTVKLMAYDSLGRLTRVTPNSLQPAVHWDYGYDAAGNMVTQTDALGRSTTFEYDNMNRRSKRILPLGQQELYSYDAAGNLTQKTNFNGQVISYSYDAANRLANRSFPGRSISFQYDPMGRRTQMQDGWGTSNYQYDSRGRLTQKSNPNGTLSYAYDASGRLLDVDSSTANGVDLEYRYDGAGRLEEVRDLRTGGGTTLYSYNDVGSLQTVSYPNGQVTTHTFDDIYRVTNVSLTQASTPLRNYAYTLRADGLRTKVTENSGRTVDYAYDNQNRLLSETIAGGSNNGLASFSYDAVNRLSRQSTVAGITNYSITNDSNDHRSDQTYNPNGAVTVANGQTFDFDAEDRLIASPSMGVTLTYDGDGNLVQKTAGGHTYTYLIDSNNPTGFAQIIEIRKNGVLAQVFNYGPNGIISQSDVASGQTRYFGKDGSNNTRILTDTSGAVTDTFDYSVDGILIGRTGTFPAVHLFQGEYFDADLGLYWLRARWMNPQSGTFMGMDTFEGMLWDPASLHKYAFTEWDSGVNKADPSGHFNFTISSVMTTVQVIGVLTNSYSATRAFQQGNIGEGSINAAFVLLDFAGVGLLQKGLSELGVAGRGVMSQSVDQFLGWAIRNRGARRIYINLLKSSKTVVEDMLRAGKGLTEVAEEAVRLRNQAKAAARVAMSAEEVAAVEARNLARYGDKLGPTVEKLLADGKSLEEIIAGAEEGNAWIHIFFPTLP